MEEDELCITCGRPGEIFLDQICWNCHKKENKKKKNEISKQKTKERKEKETKKPNAVKFVKKTVKSSELDLMTRVSTKDNRILQDMRKFHLLIIGNCIGDSVATILQQSP
jgi:hypothetical protein